MLSPWAQEYFAEKTTTSTRWSRASRPTPTCRRCRSIKPPEIDLSDLNDLKGSLELMREAGILP